MGLFGISKALRDDPTYRACIAASTVGGGIVGIQVGGASAGLTGGTSLIAGPISGATWGFVAGFLACPYLAPKIKNKLKNNNIMTEDDLDSAIETMVQYSHSKNSQQALKFVSLVRILAPIAKSGKCDAPPAIGDKIRHALKGQKGSVFSV